MEGIFWLEEYSGKPLTPVGSKRKAKSKKLEFIGWGSRPLIEFLESIGNDTAEKISQRDVSGIIDKYINDNNLLHREKKKRVVCDEKLFSIFGRKTIGRNKVFDLLDAHYPENQDGWDDDFLLSSEEENPGQEQKGLSLEKKTYQKKKVFETQKNCFAAIIRENINLVYLKKSIVLELLKDSESFETKVVDSFVRIKSDPNNFLQKKNSHQLVLVKGTKKVSGNNDTDTDIVLQVSNFVKDVTISMLSDDDFSQDECEDLHQRMKKGLLKRPTVAELEAKARILHEDITKHWIEAQLTLLPKLIARAHEKGWRDKLFEHMQLKQLLQNPDEQSRRLREVPDVRAEEVEPETAPQDIKHETDCSQISIVREISEILTDPASNAKLSTVIPLKTSSVHRYDVREQLILRREVNVESAQVVNEPEETHIVNVPEETNIVNVPEEMHIVNVPEEAHVLEETWVPQEIQVVNVPEETRVPQEIQVVNVPEETQVQEETRVPQELQVVNVPEENGAIVERNFLKVLDDTQVIELSDDDEDDEKHGDPHDEEVVALDVGSLMWHYEDPQGDIQGPFSLLSLKAWKDAGYFPDNFKVWKTGQSRNNAVLLVDIIVQMFWI